MSSKRPRRANGVRGFETEGSFMLRPLRSTRGRPPRTAEGRSENLRAFARSVQAVEMLEPRRLFAAHIVGNPTVFATIQAAVNAAVAGQTITVDPGVYSELVSVHKQLTIKGPKAGIDGRSNLRSDRAQEAVVNGKLNASGTRGTSFF